MLDKKEIVELFEKIGIKEEEWPPYSNICDFSATLLGEILRNNQNK